MSRMALFVVAFTTGCACRSGKGSGGSMPPGPGLDDTGLAQGCTPEVMRFSAMPCIETTATVEPSPTTGAFEASGTGPVVLVNDVLSQLAGSEPFGGSQRCGSQHTHRVRLVDGSGDTWTFGWALSLGARDFTPTEPSDLLDSSSAGLQVGDTLDFSVRWQHRVWMGPSVALVLSDAAGTRFLVESGMPTDSAHLAPAQRRGLSVALVRDDACITGENDEFSNYAAIFSEPGGAVRLRNGQHAIYRDLHLVVTQAYEVDPCVDGCWGEEWVAWEVP